MKPRPLLLLTLVATLAGCVDFLDPSPLNLALDSRLSISLRLTGPARSCGGDAPLLRSTTAARVSVLCLDASLRPGKDRFGGRVAIANDTLWAMGVPIVPTLDERDSTRIYSAGFQFATEELSETLLTLRFPRVEGAAFPVGELRWPSVEPAAPDTIRRVPGEGIRLAVTLPSVEPAPEPTGQFTTVTAAGSGQAVQYTAQAAPGAAYDFPTAVLDGLGGTRFNASLNWRREFSRRSSAERISVNIDLTHLHRWTVITGPASP